MKISTSKNKRIKIAVIIMAALLLMLATIGVYVYIFNGNFFGWTKPGNTLNLDKPTDEQEKAGTEIKKNAINNNSKPGTSGSDTPEAPKTQANGKSAVNVTITSTNQNNNLFQVRALISAIDTTGTCTLTLTKGQQSVVKKADTQTLPSTSTCKGFDVSTTELSSGTWNLTLDYESDTLSGSASKIVSIQ